MTRGLFRKKFSQDVQFIYMSVVGVDEIWNVIVDVSSCNSDKP
jgi:hypothetical protein